jgi:hypothetical protein
MPIADHAKALLETVAARYASMSSYSDRGAVHTQLNNDGPVVITLFSTLYKKPSLYRFDFERPRSPLPLQNVVTRNAVVFDGSTAWTWKQTGTDTPQTELAENISLAIAAATGASSGSAHRIGRLLIPAMGGLSILDLVDLRQGTDTVVDGTPCYSISARYPRCAIPDMELVIERDALLIRRIKTSGEAGKFSAMELRHSLRVNEPIEDAMIKRAA